MAQIKWTTEMNSHLIESYRNDQGVLLGNEVTWDGKLKNDYEKLLVVAFNKKFNKNYSDEAIVKRWETIRDQVTACSRKIKIAASDGVTAGQLTSYNACQDFLLNHISHKSEGKRAGTKSRHILMSSYQNVKSSKSGHEMSDKILEQPSCSIVRITPNDGVVRDSVKTFEECMLIDVDDEVDDETLIRKLFEVNEECASISSTSSLKNACTSDTEYAYSVQDLCNDGTGICNPTINSEFAKQGLSSSLSTKMSMQPKINTNELEKTDSSMQKQEVPPLDLNFPKKPKNTKTEQKQAQQLQQDLENLYNQVDALQDELMIDDIVASIRASFDKLENQKKDYALKRIIAIIKKYY
ncbi:hypothetical protein QAD02_018354 [Eretmocerus hayati]|uniref:Uncharacterized protein n=1 Tax=Eretmocerus hayati TaxID=131215 RepID=A0ACC2PGH3_9HYME|nr:hypothetical protein QAD02_018354 [Eretmocerus hayati]